jgi:hypothetical protein
MAEPSVAALVLASLVVTHAESVRRLSARPARPPARVLAMLMLCSSLPLAGSKRRSARRSV